MNNRTTWCTVALSRDVRFANPISARTARACTRENADRTRSEIVRNTKASFVLMLRAAPSADIWRPQQTAPPCTCNTRHTHCGDGVSCRQGFVNESHTKPRLGAAGKVAQQIPTHPTGHYAAPLGAKLPPSLTRCLCYAERRERVARALDAGRAATFIDITLTACIPVT